MKCSLHRKRLIDSPAFRIAGEWTPDGFSLDLMQRLPHSIHFDYKLARDAWYTEPAQISYCPDCESEARLSRAAHYVNTEKAEHVVGGNGG